VRYLTLDIWHYAGYTLKQRIQFGRLFYMKKYKFSQTERFAIWKAYSYSCFYCDQNLKWHNLTIDHLFPECLLDNRKGFMTVKKVYALKKGFCINDFVNWVPAHDACNNKKGDYMPRYSTDFEMVNRLAKVARRLHDKLLSQRLEDETLEKLISHLENNSLTTSELYKLIEKTTLLHFGLSEIEPEDTIHLPDNWKIIEIDRELGHLVVTDGQRFGKIPSALSPDETTWLCPSCKRYGPWNENQCLNCGYFQPL